MYAIIDKLFLADLHIVIDLHNVLVGSSLKIKEE